MNEDWIDRQTAIASLKVRRETLYAYVSRGLVRSTQASDDPRKSLYSRHDIEALQARRRKPRRRADVARSTIAFGEPVLESAVSTVRDGCLIYRGKNAALLAQTTTLEKTAALLWETGPPTHVPLPTRTIPSGDTAKERGFTYLAQRAAIDPPTQWRDRETLIEEAWGILFGFADAMIGKSFDGAVHRRLADHWNVADEDAELLRRALVLTADHELNPSTFAVRVAASTGAALAAAALSGLAALSGPKHGEAPLRALSNLDELCTPRKLRGQIISDMLARGEPFISFGHPLYPDGDPRAAALLGAMQLSASIRESISAAERVLGRKPNIDLALAALCRQLDLPQDAPFILFGVGRMAGWLAHAMEQTLTGDLIRPRADYTGH